MVMMMMMMERDWSNAKYVGYHHRNKMNKLEEEEEVKDLIRRIN